MSPLPKRQYLFIYFFYNFDSPAIVLQYSILSKYIKFNNVLKLAFLSHCPSNIQQLSPFNIKESTQWSWNIYNLFFFSPFNACCMHTPFVTFLYTDRWETCQSLMNMYNSKFQLYSKGNSGFQIGKYH